MLVLERSERDSWSEEMDLEEGSVGVEVDVEVETVADRERLVRRLELAQAAMEAEVRDADAGVANLMALEGS